MVTPLAAVRDRLEAAGIPDAAFEAAQLYMLATGRDARLSGGAPLSAFEQKKLDALCEKRCARFPLQYLCGEWDFLDLTLKVGPGVLIPRADTETVAEAAIEAAREAGPGCSRSFSMSRAWRWRPRTGAWPSTSISRLLISARSNRAAVSFWRSAGVRRTLCVLCAFLRDMRMCLSAVI